MYLCTPEIMLIRSKYHFFVSVDHRGAKFIGNKQTPICTFILFITKFVHEVHTNDEIKIK